jgi:hypothetical protein
VLERTARPRGTVRSDAEGRYADAEHARQAEVEWTLLRIENTASQLHEGRPYQAVLWWVSSADLPRSD